MQKAKVKNERQKPKPNNVIMKKKTTEVEASRPMAEAQGPRPPPKRSRPKNQEGKGPTWASEGPKGQRGKKSQRRPMRHRISQCRWTLQSKFRAERVVLKMQHRPFSDLPSRSEPYKHLENAFLMGHCFPDGTTTIRLAT